MKYGLLLLVSILTTSCAQLSQGVEQPVMQFRDLNTYRTTCSGMAENWANCSQKANRTCSQGYEIVEKKSDSNGLHRELIFSCKKQQ